MYIHYLFIWIPFKKTVEEYNTESFNELLFPELPNIYLKWDIKTVLELYGRRLYIGG
jgi:hypothetical protein